MMIYVLSHNSFWISVNKINTHTHTHTQNKNTGIPFETESSLRARGSAKTPDILLSCPMAVQVPKTKIVATRAMANNKINNDASLDDDDDDDDAMEWKIIGWIDSKART